MLLKLAWRNIWRNRRRSQIVVISIVVGLVSVVLFDAFSVGMIHQMLDNQIGAHVSHAQIHREGFNDNKLLQNVIPDPDRVVAVLEGEPLVKAYSRRVITFGILSSPTSSSGVTLVGIDPEREMSVTEIKSLVVEGVYLEEGKRGILIGRSLAEKLDVALGDKVVAMASRLDGRIGSDVFRISGLFETFNTAFDKSTAYVPIASTQQMLGLDEAIHEFAIIARDFTQTGRLTAALKSALADTEKNAANYEVLSYRELLPLLVMQVDVYRESIGIFYGIVALAMLFGIVNTMLMSVMERTSEFGVLMAMGMKNRRIFVMVILEALLLGILGTLIGVALSYLIYLPLSRSGIDLSAFAAGLNSLGSSSTLYPLITREGLLSALLIVPFAAVIGAIYPALKAMRLAPVEAMRHV